MDKKQILRDYREAKNQKRQIPILADLNLCTQDEIKSVLHESGYLMVFNPNGVDVSLRANEIKERYSKGDDVTTLSKAFYVSHKGIRQILGIEEDIEVAENTKETIESLNRQIKEKDAAIAELRQRLHNCEEKSKCVMAETKAYHTEDEWQQMCIKINNLNVTIDTLVDRLALLRSVARR